VVSEPVPVRFDVVDVDIRPRAGWLGGVAVGPAGGCDGHLVPGSDVVE
jgi:hypothetical protein